LKQKLVCALPHAGFCAIKHSAHDARGMVRIETTAVVETRIANYFGTLPYDARDLDTCRVVIHASDETTWIGGILAESMAPQAAETCDRDQHLIYAPFNRLFSRRCE